MSRAPSGQMETAVSHPALRALLARWHAHRGASALPSEEELSFINLGPWRGSVRRVETGDGDHFRLLPCAQSRIEPSGELFDADYRSAVRSRAPVRVMSRASGIATGWQETLILPFARRDQRVGLLLVGSYAALLAEDADERRHQERQQRGSHEKRAGRALEKA